MSFPAGVSAENIAVAQAALTAGAKMQTDIRQDGDAWTVTLITARYRG